MRDAKFCMVTFGCQMNERDSQIMSHLLDSKGMTASALDDARITVINTCHIRQHAEQRALSLVGKLKEWRGVPGRVLVLAGCVAEAYGVEMLHRFPHLDLVIGPSRLMELPRLLESAGEGRERVTAVGMAAPRTVPELGRERAAGRRGFVKIMEGCSYRCSFCVVPRVRGPARSRPSKDIVAQIEGLAASGLREVTLLGQAVNAYGLDTGEEGGFAGLLRRLDRIDGLRRIRFISSHPANFGPEAIGAVAECGKVCEHVHLPVQSGSDAVLRRMRRAYGTKAYMDLLGELRRRVPGISVTTDLIVGFPGETKADFAATLEAVRNGGFETAFAFKYSPRPGTAAADMEGQIPEELKAERLKRLNAALANQSREHTHALIGCIQEVMVEEGPDSNGMWRGRLRSNRLVNVAGRTGETAVGDLVKVTIERAGDYSLKGRPAVAERAG